MQLHADMILVLANPPMHIAITTHAAAHNTNAAVMSTWVCWLPGVKCPDIDKLLTTNPNTFMCNQSHHKAMRLKM